MSDNQHNKNEPVVAQKQSLPYATRTLDPPISLVDRAREIQDADKNIRVQVTGKLELIAQQIRRLQQDAQNILEQAQTDRELHRVRCGFEKKPGQTLHLYQTVGGELYFSLLSPRDWRQAPPDDYRGSYRLRQDMSFERLDDPELKG